MSGYAQSTRWKEWGVWVGAASIGDSAAPTRRRGSLLIPSGFGGGRDAVPNLLASRHIQAAGICPGDSISGCAAARFVSTAALIVTEQSRVVHSDYRPLGPVHFSPVFINAQAARDVQVLTQASLGYNRASP